VNTSPNTTLLTSSDGARSFSELFAGAGKLLGFAISPDGASVAFGGPLDGVVVAGLDGAGAERRSDVAPTCLAWRDDGLYACVDAATGASLGRMDHAARGFEPLLRFAELEGPTACGAETFVGSVCPSAWDDLVPRFTSGEAGAGGAADGAAGGGNEDGRSAESLRFGGGCSFSRAQGDAACAVWLGVPLILLSRSRRWRTRP
jgi:hypothetical protein